MTRRGWLALRVLHAMSALCVLLAFAGGAVGCTQRYVPCTEDYASCGTEATCASGAPCDQFFWRDGGGSICSRPCDTETDCPREGGRAGRCLDANASGRRFCFRECASDLDCPMTWVCQPIINQRGEEGAVCMP